MADRPHQHILDGGLRAGGLRGTGTMQSQLPARLGAAAAGRQKRGKLQVFLGGGRLRLRLRPLHRRRDPRSLSGKDRKHIVELTKGKCMRSWAPSLVSPEQGMLRRRAPRPLSTNRRVSVRPHQKRPDDGRVALLPPGAAEQGRGNVAGGQGDFQRRRGRFRRV